MPSVSEEPKKSKLSNGLKMAVRASGLSHYRICKTAGIDQGAFSKFMAGKVGLRMDNLDAVAEAVGFSGCTQKEGEP